MPIRFYEGIEGSHKSAMMTRDLLLHHRSGGKVMAFPGYELKEDDGKIVSEVMMPEDWVTLPATLKMQKIAIAIDEVTNFFNNHVWYNKICDMMAGLLAERRKFEIAVLMTGPFYRRLPPNIQEFIHEVVHCSDHHTRNHDVARGERCIYYKEDLRGLLSPRFPDRRFTTKRVFYSKPYWKNYDTYQAVDIINQFIKVKFKGREIIVGADGKIMQPNEYGTSDPATLERFVNQYKEQHDNKLEIAVKQLLNNLKDKGVKRIPRDIVWQYFKADNNKALKKSIGSILKSYGAKATDRDKGYELSGISM
jgi:hypothetical protein